MAVLEAKRCGIEQEITSNEEQAPDHLTAIEEQNRHKDEAIRLAGKIEGVVELIKEFNDLAK